MDHWANNLMASLYFAESGFCRPLILTTSLYTQIYLTGLSVLGILPPLKIERLNRKAKIQLYLDQLSRGDYPHTLIVARDVYTNYHGLIKDVGQSTKQILVF